MWLAELQAIFYWWHGNRVVILMKKDRPESPKLQLIPAKIRKGINYLTDGGLHFIFNRIDQLKIKKGVDSMGVDKFVNQCALMAAGSGVAAGAGGIGTMLLGMPLDMINLITQQFRVTLAVSYHQTGSYKVKFDDFIKIVASSLKIDARMAVTKNVLEQVAEKLLLNMGSKTVRRLVPIIGAAIGGSVNYFFIKKVAEGLMVVDNGPIK